MTSNMKKSEPTREEFIAGVQKKMASYWLNSSPLFLIHQEDERLEFLPLDEEVLKKTWIFLFFDPTTFSGESALSYAQELDRRYRSHSVRVGMIYHSSYLWSRVKRHIYKWAESHRSDLPIVFDHDDLLKSFFKFSGEPLVMVMTQGKIVLERSGPEGYSQVESFLQGFLRKSDPGLALLPVLSSIEGLAHDVMRLELGFLHSWGEKVEFEGVSFQEVDSHTRLSVSDGEEYSQHNESRGIDSQLSLSPRVHLHGNWGQDWERIWTADSNATLQWDLSSERIALVAQPLAGEPRDTCRIEVELNEQRPSSDHLGSDLKYSDEGQAVLDVSFAGLFHLLRHLPQGGCRVILRFPQASQFPIALYGLRSGSTSFRRGEKSSDLLSELKKGINNQHIF